MGQQFHRPIDYPLLLSLVASEMEDSGFAGAVRSDNPDEFVSRHLDTEVGHRAESAKKVCYVACLKDRHCLRSLCRSPTFNGRSLPGIIHGSSRMPIMPFGRKSITNTK